MADDPSIDRWTSALLVMDFQTLIVDNYAAGAEALLDRTAKLIAATPKPGTQLADLAAIPGNLPDVTRADLPTCRYSARCERHSKTCDAPLPLVAIGPSHMVACWQPL